MHEDSTIVEISFGEMLKTNFFQKNTAIIMHEDSTIVDKL